MAKKVTKTNEYSGFDELPESTQAAAEKDYVAWDKKTNIQRLDSIADYQASIINKVAGIARDNGDRSGVFWEQGKTIAELDKNMPFNGNTGLPYTSLDGVLMRSVMAIEGYKEPIFLTMRQANLMGGTLKKTGEMTRNGKEEYQLGVKIAMLRTNEFVPTLDEQGNKIYEPKLDEDGNKVLTKNGEEVKIIKGEWKALKEPMYESVTLYNIEQFDNLDRTKLQKLDTKALQAKRDNIVNNKSKPNFNLGLIKKGLDGKPKTGSRTIENLYEFIKAAQTGRDFTPKQEIKVNLQATKEFAQTQEKQQSFSR